MAVFRGYFFKNISFKWIVFLVIISAPFFFAKCARPTPVNQGSIIPSPGLRIMRMRTIPTKMNRYNMN